MEKLSVEEQNAVPPEKDVERQQPPDSRDLEVLGKTTSAHTVPPSEPPVERTQSIGEDYSAFTQTQKKIIVVTASFAALFSPMATAIYYPSLTTIAEDLNVLSAKISITVTLFLVIQGVAPAFIADLADKTGRRPMYIVCFTIFSIANIGLALQNNYVALLILRMLQSAGSSGTVALANGVVGDLVTSAERGTFIAFASLGTMLGPMVSPILGGVIGQYAGWHFIFWFLLIFSSAIYIPLILFLPETCRNIVDNGSIPPPLFSRNITDFIRHRRKAKLGVTYNEAKQAEMREKYKFRAPNPLATLKVLVDPESAIILLATGLGLGCFYAISTGASSAFTALYGFNQVQISLMFIPIGVGSIVSALSTGRLVDWNFRRHSALLGLPVTKNRRQDLTNFPIEKARLQVAFPIVFLGGTFLIAYGWILTRPLNLAAPIVSLFILGYGLTSVFQTLNVFMIDIHPGKPSVATAANNFVRCEIGAVFSAVVIPLTDAIGTGWAYTLLALIYIAFSPILLYIMRKGPQWRKKKKEKNERAKNGRKKNEGEKNEGEKKERGTT